MYEIFVCGVRLVCLECVLESIARGNNWLGRSIHNSQRATAAVNRLESGQQLFRHVDEGDQTGGEITGRDVGIQERLQLWNVSLPSLFSLSLSRPLFLPPYIIFKDTVSSMRACKILCSLINHSTDREKTIDGEDLYRDRALRTCHASFNHPPLAT